MKVKDNTKNGTMEEHLKESGKIIKWMDMEFLDGLMVDNIKEIMLMIKKKDMVNFFGQVYI